METHDVANEVTNSHHQQRVAGASRGRLAVAAGLWWVGAQFGWAYLMELGTTELMLGGQQ